MPQLHTIEVYRVFGHQTTDTGLFPKLQIRLIGSSMGITRTSDVWEALYISWEKTLQIV